ncbi:uncharacterized protein LOC114354592 [Ostrinia furnacalis]|uniref:uncharacterized protein LOC114354592 n=1 Tax=Ostrinia furnacalis TaxID=93504 RepID=UPI00103CFBB3|nr:uncharacterized protein LOC114354592 [Ostrinia furnacalis]
MSSLDIREVPRGSGLERPLHAPKRKRILPSATVTNIREHVGAWSTDDAGLPSVPIDIPTDVPDPTPARGCQEYATQNRDAVKRYSQNLRNTKHCNEEDVRYVEWTRHIGFHHHSQSHW